LPAPLAPDPDTGPRLHEAGALFVSRGGGRPTVGEPAEPERRRARTGGGELGLVAAGGAPAWPPGGRGL